MVPLHYSRAAFEASSQPDRLATELAQSLLPRLVGAQDPSAEALAIVADLRNAGHELWSWDESIDFSIWGDDYASPPSPNRFLIEMRWPDPDDEEPSGFVVVVTFGPWPR